MDLNDAAVFAKVVETGSFTEAARLLRHPKSSVSRTVSRLEDELGVRLLQRTTRSLSLTEAGHAFYDRARGALQDLDDAATAARELGGEPRGTVRLTAPPHAESRLHEAIASFVAKYPAIHVEVSLTPRVVDLVAEGFDLALRMGKLADSRLVAKKLGASTLMLFASPAYLKKHGRPQTLAEVAKHPCVIVRGKSGRATWTVLKNGREESIEVSGPIEVDDYTFAAQLAVAGTGIAFLPLMNVAQMAHRGELEAVLSDYHSEETPMHLVLPSSSFVPARVLLLRDWIADHYERELAALHSQCKKRRG